MKRLFSILRYFFLACLILILFYGFFKNDPYLIKMSGLLCAFWFLFLLYDKIKGKKKLIDIGLLAGCGLLLILCVVTFLGP